VGLRIDRYIYLPIDTPATLLFMQSPKTAAAASRQKEYARLRAQLAHIGWISEGYVQDRGPGAGGACYPWTRKVKGKTVCVALSKEQYEWLKQAIANWRVVQKTLRQMQRLSREELFQSLPGPKRRKKLSKKVLGLV
jgi:cyclopropane fatty-acyl-phospholipid synthase-like methyltransferase